MDKSHLCASEHLHKNQIHCAFGNAYCWWCLSELCFSKCQILPRLWVVTLAAFVWHIFVTLTPLISSISPTKGEEDALSKERKVSPNRPGLAQMATFTKSQSLYLSASKHSYLPEFTYSIINFQSTHYTALYTVLYSMSNFLLQWGWGKC